MTATIKANELAAMLRAIAPHMSTDADLPVLCAMQIEARDGHLFAAATDRYTLAVRRAEHCGGRPDWLALVPAPAIDSIRAWLKTWDAETIEIEVSDADPNSTTARTLTLYGPGRQLCLTVPADSGRLDFAPNWRNLLRPILAREMAPVAAAFTTEYLARWAKAGEKVSLWTTGATKPLVILGHNLLGAQQPINEGNSPKAAEASLWQRLLTRTSAEVDGELYDLAQKWRDNDGDLWMYSGDDTRDGEPLMTFDDADELDKYTIRELIAEWGPLQATGIPV